VFLGGRGKNTCFFLRFFSILLPDDNMQGMNKQFQSICAFLSEADMKALFTVTFPDVCRHFNADIRALDNMCYDTFGMSGDELIEHYRSREMNCIE
jgi:hypothetical protein